MIKVTRDQTGADQVLLKIEGVLTSDSLDHLRRAIASEAGDTPLVIDLSGVASLDADGRAFLVQLKASGHSFRGASLYLKHLLEEDHA